MVESKHQDIEKIMLDAVKFGHENFVPIIVAIENLKKVGKTKWEVENVDHTKVRENIKIF